MTTSRKAINSVKTLDGLKLSQVLSTWGLTYPVAYLGTLKIDPYIVLWCGLNNNSSDFSHILQLTWFI